MSTAERVIVFWAPDWPILAHLRDRAKHEEEPADVPPLALTAQHRVVACSASARAEGVHTGIREREAQSLLPSLSVHPHHPETDERQFAPILTALEACMPGIEPLRPGLCALRARGPARYYGGEAAAAQVLLERAATLGVPGARVGIADGRFAAEQAARATRASSDTRITIVPAGAAAEFLAPLPVSRVADPRFAETLHGLGIHTLGALAALPAASVRQRFGAAGVAAQQKALAAGPVHGSEVRPRDPVSDFSVALELEPPIDTAEQLSFACAGLAESFISSLTEAGLVCTALRVELTDDIGVRHEREWQHPSRFTPADTVGRVRWQAESIARATDRTGSGVARVRITPTHTDRASAHEPGLWNTEPDERVHHHLTRTQARLGHAGVGTAQLSGGRLLRDRWRFVPWGTAPASRSPTRRGAAGGPWPGALPAPHPSRVFPEPLPATLADETGAPVQIDTDDLLTAPPVTLGIGGRPLSAPVHAWSQPWPVREHWWTGDPARHRIQLQLADGDAWLLTRSGEDWFAEGHYD